MDQIREWRIPKSRVLRMSEDNCNRKGCGSVKPTGAGFYGSLKSPCARASRSRCQGTILATNFCESEASASCPQSGGGGLSFRTGAATRNSFLSAYRARVICRKESNWLRCVPVCWGGVGCGSVGERYRKRAEIRRFVLTAY